MSKEHVEKMRGEWPLIPPGNTVAGNIEASKIRVPVYQQMVKSFNYKYVPEVEQEISNVLNEGWLVKTMVPIDSGIVVIFERCD
jgi:hypothetical protein